MKFLKKIIRRLCWEIIWRRNIIGKFFYSGKLKIGKKTRFYQRLKLMNGGRGSISIGNGNSFGYRYGGGFKNGEIEIQARSNEAKIEIGNNIATNNNIFICSRKSIKIEDDVLIGRNVVIMDHNTHGIKPNERRSNPGTAREIIIKRNVWLGNYVTVLSGSIIGENSIVGSGSVVKGIFPANVIIQGNPAKIIKKIAIEEKNEK